MCPISTDPFYIVTYYIKWVTTSWTYSRYNKKRGDDKVGVPGDHEGGEADEGHEDVMGQDEGAFPAESDSANQS